METMPQPSRLIGPEDIKPGDYVTIVHTTHEVVKLPDDDWRWSRGLEPARVTLMSDCAGWPLKVVEVCLPFVLVKDVRGRHGPIDLRRHRLARLSDTFGRRTFKAFKTAGKQPQVSMEVFSPSDY